MNISNLPKQILVKELVSSRYDDLWSSGALPQGERPESWSQRREGIDKIITEDGLELNLISDGAQTPPKEKSRIMLTSGDQETGFKWTLYGI